MNPRWYPLAVPGPAAPPAPAMSAGALSLPEAELPAIDRSVLDDLQALQRPGKPDRVAKILHLFLTGAPALIGSMRDALARGDAPGVADAAHALKSSSGFVGACRLMALCHSLEQLGRRGTVAEAPPVFARLETEYAAAAAELAEEERKR